MLNFATLFNQFRAPPSNSLGDILSMPNPSLMRLLDDDTFIAEFKSATSRVQQFMTYKRYAELIQFITEIGEPLDKKRSFKFPLTVCEMLTSDNAVIGEFMLSNKGFILLEEKIVKTVEEEVEQVVEDDEEQEQQGGKWEAGQQPETTATTTEGEEEFGDFVEAPPPKTKIVKVKQVVEITEIVSKELPLLIDALFAYFQKQINYTLTGYVCKVLTSLLNKKSPQFLGKFFADEKIGQNLLNHIESRSAVELLVRIFTIQTDLLITQRIEYYFRMVRRLSRQNQIEASSNLSACACEVFEKLAIHLKTINPIKELREYLNNIPALLELVVNNIISEDQNSSVYSVPFVYQLLNSLPAQVDQSSLQQSLKLLIEGAFQKLKRSVQESRVRLGMGRVKLTEIIGFLFKKTWIREWAANKQNFFSVLLALVRQFPLNNILHNEVFKILGSVLNFQKAQDLDQKLLEGLLNEDRLLLWLEEQAQQESNRLKQNKNSLPKGYAGHLVKLCKQLKDSANKSQLIQQLVEDNRFLAVVKTLIEKESMAHQRNLAGYAMIKNTKYQIMFSRQQILVHHANFLSKSPPSVFVASMDDPMEDPAVLEELQRQLDGYQEANSNKPIEVIEEEKHKAELIQENDEHKSAFWKVHLDYNVDSLIDEMM